MRGWGFPEERVRRTPSRIAQMPLTSSAARIVSPPEYSTPSFSLTLMPWPFLTRSIWLQNRTDPFLVPGRMAMRFPVSPPNVRPASSSLTVKPKASSFLFRTSASIRSFPDAQSMPTSSLNSSSMGFTSASPFSPHYRR